MKAKDLAKYKLDQKMAREIIKEKDLAKYKADQKRARESLKEKFFALGNKYETWNGDYFVHISAPMQ